MNINENVNFNAQVTVKDDKGVDTVVMYLGATLDTANMNTNINCNTVNKVLASANAADVKAQYEEFETAVKARATELGYVIF
ncbi:hypothetical protein [Candidatus Clostridium stratigraminis]|uniref:Uncharacterized protein n=1 Tax=Candidatus Clostridium stratigraminis TaxID=3381661 RepID=A0ABW8SZ37_9CLOT